jgi:flagellar hook protein FlgE
MSFSFNTSLSGLNANSNALNVVGNNIANANTAGFKASTVLFQDTLSQMLIGATGANADRGGTNPIQVGLGVQVAATHTNFLQGSSQITGREPDLMIQGDGFFVVQRNGQNLYTRAGAFSFDEAGDLTTTKGGNRVQGYALDASGNADIAGGLINISLDTTNAVPAVPAGVKMTSYEIGATGMVSATFDDGIRRDLCQLAIADFNNPMGLSKIGETAFIESAKSGAPQLDVAGQGSRGVLMGNALEMSNVDLAAEFTNLILAQRGFQASSRVITTSDQILEDLVNIKR